LLEVVSGPNDAAGIVTSKSPVGMLNLLSWTLAVNEPMVAVMRAYTCPQVLPTREEPGEQERPQQLWQSMPQQHAIATP
jgi:hypothetical protein